MRLIKRGPGAGSESGFTMIEVLVAMIILAIGLLGVAGIQALSIKQVSNSSIRSLATMHAYDLSERMRSEIDNVLVFEKADSTSCGGCDSKLANWHDRVLADIATASTAVDVDSSASATSAEITIAWSERDLGDDAVNQSYTLYVRLR